MSTQQIICTIILVVLLVAIVIYKIKTIPTEQQKLEAKEFLDKISDSLLVVIKNTLSRVNPDTYLNLELFLDDVYTAIYEEVWVEVEKQIEESFKDNPDYNIIVKLIDRESVERLVDSLVTREGLEAKLSAVFEETMKAKLESMEEEDKKAAQIAEAYENGTVVHEDYEEPEEESVPIQEEELPESISYDTENDDTVELLSEDKEV